MQKSETAMQSIYLAMIGESIARLCAAQTFLAAYDKSHSIPEIEAAILQVRKALEAAAFAAIAPNQREYEVFRAKANDKPDYRQDYHARKILHDLSKINKDFYPRALLPPTRKADGTLHFERKLSGYLTKKRFESLYNRLGKHLHAHNPWSNDKNLQNLAAHLPTAINELFELLDLHVTFIQTPQFSGAWIIEAGRDSATPRIITGVAQGEFVVQDS